MNRKDAGVKAFEMLAEAERYGVSTYDTVTLVRDSDGTYAVADNGDAEAGLNEHEAIALLNEHEAIALLTWGLMMDHN